MVTCHLQLHKTVVNVLNKKVAVVSGLQSHPIRFYVIYTSTYSSLVNPSLVLLINSAHMDCVYHVPVHISIVCYV